MLSGARDLGLHALIVGGTPERLQEFSVKAKDHGIEIYYWLAPRIPEGFDKSPFEQRMPRSDEELLERLKSRPEEWRKTYQFGGEPVDGHEEVSKTPSSAFIIRR